MSERPAAPPEGALISAALKRTKLSARAAARQAGISDARWRQITSGYQTVSGTHVAVRAPADTLARMARVVGVTPEQLTEAGRDDAADELRALPPAEADSTSREPTIAELAAEIAEQKRLTSEHERRAAEQERRFRDLERRFEELEARQDEEHNHRGKAS